MNDVPLLADWIAHVFDHPVAKPTWYWATEALCWEGSHEEVVVLIAETFERSAELLAHFTDAQLDQGFWYLVHWQRRYPRLEAVVDQFLARTQNLRPELVIYAQYAKAGRVL